MTRTMCDPPLTLLEIAELLGLPVATVMIRTRSALAHLAVRLEDL